MTSCENNSKEKYVDNSNNTSNEVDTENNVAVDTSEILENENINDEIASSEITDEYKVDTSKEYILNLGDYEIDLEVLLVNNFSKVQELNGQELDTLRNAYYAKYGYIFQNSDYNEFFKSQNWYQPNESIKDINSLLTQVDWKNIDLIREIENMNNSNGIELKFKDLGFSLIIPSSWEENYYIDKDEQGIGIFFKPNKNPIPEGGHLFSILDTEFVDYEYMLDTVGNKHYLVVEGRKYVIGGPTDVNFPEDHEEFYTFYKMGKQVGHIIDTLKIID